MDVVRGSSIMRRGRGGMQTIEVGETASVGKRGGMGRHWLSSRGIRHRQRLA